MKYRREIDGLRSIAVLPVIFFHAGITIFSGGYVGVDIFFVISGYLITTIIVSEQQAGKFTITNFYERRARRILPALFLVMLACIPFAWAWMTPAQLKDFSQSLIAVSTFSSNILFWRESGYFSPAAEFKPLLHTWSLAVEEQYYIFFPLFILATWRFGKKTIFFLLLLIGFSSLLLSLWALPNYPIANFYLLPTRLWELLIGSLAAIHLLSKEPDNSAQTDSALLSNQFLSCVGLGLILYSIFAFSDDTPFSSFYAPVPTAGTVLIILFASKKTLVARLLSHKLPVAIGLVSYSAYLWHQPLFAFARIKVVDGPSHQLMLSLCALSLGLAYFTWKFVEQPFRQKSRYPRRLIFQMTAAGSTVIVLIGISGHMGNGFPKLRYTASQLELLTYTNYSSSDYSRKVECFLGEQQNFTDFKETCISAKLNKDSILIWGDSHAQALAGGITEPSDNILLLSASGCPPILGVIIGDRPNCPGINEFVLSQIELAQPRTIILHADWLLYDGQNVSDSVPQTVTMLREKAPLSRIVIIGSVPQWRIPLPEAMFRHGVEMNKTLMFPTPMLPELYAIDTEYRELSETMDIDFVSILESLCDTDRCMSVIQSGDRFEPLAWDYGHLTFTGSTYVIKHILTDKYNIHL